MRIHSLSHHCPHANKPHALHTRVVGAQRFRLQVRGASCTREAHLSKRRGAQQLEERVEAGVPRGGGALLLLPQVPLQRALASAAALRQVEANRATLSPGPWRQRHRKPRVAGIDEEQVVQQAERQALAARCGAGAQARAELACERLHEGLHARKPGGLHSPPDQTCCDALGTVLVAHAVTKSARP